MLDTQREVPSAAALRPSSVVANFQVTNGRRCSTANVQTALSARASVGAQARFDVDAGGPQRGRSPGGDRVGVGLGEHHAAYTGCDQRLGAGTGATGVVARLEGDYRRGARGGRAGVGQRVGLGVRRAGSAVESLGDHPAVVGQQHAADAGVGPERYAGGRRELEGAQHRDLLCVGERHRLLFRSVADSGADGKTDANRSSTSPACASHPDFDRRSRNFTWSTGHWL